MKAQPFMFLIFILMMSGCGSPLQRAQDQARASTASAVLPTSLPSTDTATRIPQPAIDQQEAIKRAITIATTPIPEVQPPTTPPTVLDSTLVTQSAARQRLRSIQPQIDLPESEKMVWLITLIGQWSNPLGANAIYDRYLFVIDASTGEEIYKYLYDTKTIGG